MKIGTYKKTREIIEKYDFVFRKNFGQNFLIDQNILNKIIDSGDITKDDVVIEIGPGIGSLTEPLAEKAFKVVAIEIDNKLIPILNDTLSSFDNIEIINADILKFDISEVIDKYPDKNIKIVANLPYYITTPIIMNLLENKYNIQCIIVMVQKEVAIRIQSKPGIKSYGSISLAVQYYSTPEIVANVPGNCFIPRPNVDSAVIKLMFYKKPSVNTKNEKLMFEIIRMVFNQRRKTFVNAISNQGNFNLSKEELINILESLGYDKNIRGEKFSLEDFSLLTDYFSDLI